MNDITLLDEYQERAAVTAIYPSAGSGNTQAAVYCALGLAGEAGEVANKLKKVLRQGLTTPPDGICFDVKQELGDVLWYVARLADELGYSLSDVATSNIGKLKDRLQRNLIEGEGDGR